MVSLTDKAAVGILSILVLLVYVDYILCNGKFPIVFVLKSNNNFSARFNMIVL